MKTTLYFSISVLLVALVCRAIVSQQVATDKTYLYVLSRNKTLMVQGKVAGDLKAWMVIQSFNGKDFPGNGFDPTYTHITADYKPMFRQLHDGRWEILFTSPIAENLP